MIAPNRTITPPKRSRNLAQGIVDDLSAKIRDGIYAYGAKLPTEPELMATHGVSRTVVREAISRLQASGMVETRHGIGTFVLTPDERTLPEVNAAITLRDVIAMLELRISLEAEAASLAALRRKEEHLAAMRDAVDRFEREIKGGQKAVEADFQFHLQIALATGNRYFEEFLRYLGTTTIPRTRLDIWQISPEPGPAYLYRTNQEHERILHAIESKDPESARAAMRMHLADSRERLLRLVEQAEAQGQR